ncbi:hypothetical protein ACFV3R_03920 [Streptomyces sp. NPDC059740]|uniref:hypothetical protein n=1 Tax=Streptomyces sp. NPDC059740 TaxID=3346926 RepID=UPI003662F60D
MDEGLATFYSGIGALIGAVITAVLGAIVTHRTSRHSAAAAAQAVVDQVKEQALSEQAHWIRQQRHAAYSAVYRGYADFVLSVAPFSREDRARERREAGETLFEKYHNLAAGIAEIALIGPDQVSGAATDLRKACRKAYRICATRGMEEETSSYDAELGQAETGMGQALSRFETACRSVLLEGAESSGH